LYHCPEPVPIAVSEMGILKGAPNINSARVFVNWFLSKEGQIAQYVADYAPPVHKELRRKEFVPFADEILPKKGAFRDPVIEVEIQPKLLAFWDELWMRGGARRRSP
jgi:ABC-type Fe3+ transport system substrate-binding protein